MGARPSRWFPAVALAAAVVLSACGGAAAPTATPAKAPAAPAATQPAAATATPTRAAPAPTPTATSRAAVPTPTPLAVATKPQGAIKVALTVDAHERMDPRNYNHAWQVATLYSLYESLVWKDLDGNNAPGLATKWALRDDNLTWEFTLRQGVRYHNGAVVKMEDVLYSIETFMDPTFLSSIGQTLARTLDKFYAEGDRLIVKTKEPDPILLMNVGGFGGGRPGAAVIPKTYAESKGKDGFKNAPIGTGPWKFKSIERGVSVTLEAFEDHWFEPRRATVKEVTLLVVPETTTRVALAKTGEADIVDGLALQDIKGLRAIPGGKVVETLAGRVWLGFAEQRDPKSPFADLRVRQAINYAVDWDAVNKALFEGLGQPYNGVVEPGAFGHDPTVKNPYTYDAAKAKALLAQAGYPNGFQTSYFTPVANVRWIQAVQSYLNAVGVKADIKTADDATYWATIRQNAQAVGTLKGIFTQGYSFQPDAYFAVEGSLASYGQYTSINDPELDALYAKTKVAMDPKERARLFGQIQRMSLDKAYYAFGLLTPAIDFVGPRVDSFRPLNGLILVTGWENVRLKR